MFLFTILFIIGTISGLPFRNNFEKTAKIIGGRNATIDEYAYTCQLNWNGQMVCGCAIIRKDVVVTAAHCTDGAVASQLSVRAGATFRNAGGVVSPVSEIVQHPDFNPTTLDCDLSILFLAQPFNFTLEIEAIRLPDDGTLWGEGLIGFYTGWGSTLENGPDSDVLNIVYVPVVSNQNCRDSYGTSAVTDNMMCAGEMQGGAGGCTIDTGGPLNMYSSLGGIASWSYGCGRVEYPGVFTSIGMLRSFINETIGE